MTVCAQGQIPVRIPDADIVVGAMRPAEAGIVLRAAIDVIKGLLIVDSYFVELRNWHVGHEAP